MRRPHVYERSVPRVRRDAGHEAPADYSSAARAVLAATPALLAATQACGAVILARHPGQALSEARRS